MGYLNSLPEEISKTIRIIESLPVNDESITKKFRFVSYGDLFHNLAYFESLASPVSQSTAGSSRKSSTAAVVPTSNGLVTPSPRPPSSNDPAVTTWAAKLKSAVERSPSPTRLATPPPPGKPQTPATQIPPPTRDENGILRSHLGARIDTPVKQYNKEEVNRIKKLKLCNVNYLRAPCPYESTCGHRHDYKLKKGELDTLRLVARMAPCDHGTECDDTCCIYGHVCPAPDANERTKLSKEAVAAGKTCIFGEQCRFGGEMHFKV
jgi:hypothetical protein